MKYYLFRIVSKFSSKVRPCCKHGKQGVVQGFKNLGGSKMAMPPIRFFTPFLLNKSGVFDFGTRIGNVLSSQLLIE